METIINNLLNGNVSDAKKAARRVTYAALERYLVEEQGWVSKRAINAALFLKGIKPWKAYCDEDHRLTRKPEDHPFVKKSMDGQQPNHPWK